MNLGFLHYKSLSQIFCHRIKQIDYALYDENDENQFEGSRRIKCHTYGEITRILFSADHIRFIHWSYGIQLNWSRKYFASKEFLSIDLIYEI